MSRGLQFKNAAVSLLLLVPLILLIVALLSVLASRPVPSSPVPDDPPPLLILSEAQGYTFATGSATPSIALLRALTDSIPRRIATLAATHSSNVVEVIGHTDGQRVASRGSLDDGLIGFIQNGAAAPSAGSNVDLGMLRAWEVARILKSAGGLSHLSFVAYSAGQVLDTNGVAVESLTFEDLPHRRRIEIRLRTRVP